MIAPSSYLSYARFRHLKRTLLLLIVAIAIYLAHDPVGGRSGSTWVGYGLGVLCAGLILWLLWFGVRKRRYAAAGAPLRGWLSAHVYLGASLLILVPLHSAFELGWNVHSLAYVLMVLVVLSGMVGVALYGWLPMEISENRPGQELEGLLQQIADHDREARRLARGLPDALLTSVRASIENTFIGGGLVAQLAARDARCPVAGALAQLRRSGGLDDESRENASRLIELLSQKRRVLGQVRREVRHRALLDLWLLVHVPVSFATLAAVAVHVFSVFWYR